MRRSLVTVILAIPWTAVAQQAAAPRPDQDAQTLELAKKTQNPISDRISVPPQNNPNFGDGAKDAPKPSSTHTCGLDSALPGAPTRAGNDARQGDRSIRRAGAGLRTGLFEPGHNEPVHELVDQTFGDAVQTKGGARVLGERQVERKGMGKRFSCFLLVAETVPGTSPRWRAAQKRTGRRAAEGW